MVIYLERGADLHMAQLIPLPLTISCFSKIQIAFTFLVPAHPGSPGKGPLNGCVCVVVVVVVVVVASSAAMFWCFCRLLLLKGSALCATNNASQAASILLQALTLAKRSHCTLLTALATVHLALVQVHAAVAVNFV